MKRALLVLLAAGFLLGGCSGGGSHPKASEPKPAAAYTPQPDPSVLAGQAEFAQFRKSVHPLWLALKKALEEGAGNPTFDALQQQFAAVQVNLKDPVKKAAAAEFVRDCGLRCVISTAQRTSFAVKATTGELRQAEEDDRNNKAQALEFVQQFEQKWKDLEAGQLVPAADAPDLKIGEKIYMPDGGYVGMVKESKVDKGEMQWVVSAPDGSEQIKPLKQWQGSGALVAQ